jgi:hypothetical protein
MIFSFESQILEAPVNSVKANRLLNKVPIVDAAELLEETEGIDRSRTDDLLV